MKIRVLERDDLDSIIEIHSRFYSNEFEIPNLFDKFLTAFVIENDDSEIITAGGVRTLTELVLITDKSKTVRARREALLEALQISSFISEKSGYDQLHAFVQGNDWINQLIKTGFRNTKGQALVIEV